MAEETITEVADAPETITAEAPATEAPVVETEASEAPARERREPGVRPNTKPIAIDKDALAAKISDKFAAAFKEDGDEVEEAPAEVEAEKAPEAGEPEAKVETTPEAVEEAAAPSNAPTLPASYRRSLKAYEWTDEEIDANLKALGPAFISSAAKIHATRAKEVAQWAEMGRQARANVPAPQANQKPITEEAALQPLDPKALKAKYGDEALIDDIVTPINQTIERMNKMLPTIQQHQKRAEQANLETLDRQVQAFFGGKELEPYKEVYGKGELLPQHYETRQKVLEHADALIGGARMQGRNLSLDEALTLAHDSVTAPIKTQAAKADLAAKLTARNKAITMRPNTRGPATGSVAQGVAKTRGEMENRVKLGLSKLFN